MPSWSARVANVQFLPPQRATLNRPFVLASSFFSSSSSALKRQGYSEDETHALYVRRDARRYSSVAVSRGTRVSASVL